ncbi:MAG: hypothetical protein AB1689_17890 [Thermodesulfobacteriota bacterium]
MNRLRILMAAALTAMMALPTGRVFTAGPPTFDHVKITGNDFVELGGRGTPGAVFQVLAKQRNFKEGVGDGESGDQFQNCQWKNNGNPYVLGTATVNAEGKWLMAVDPTNQLQAFGSTVGGDACGAGLRTDLYVVGSTPPVVHWLNVAKPTGQTAGVRGALEFADQVSALITDGPDQGDDPSYLNDKDEDWYNTCASGTCGRRVSFKANGGTYPAPLTSVLDSTNFITTDREYPFLLAGLGGFKSGAATVAFSQVVRQDAPINIPTILIHVKISGLPPNLCNGPNFNFPISLI